MKILNIPLGRKVKVIGGFAFRSGQFTDKGIPIVRISNIMGDGTIDFSQDIVYYPHSYGPTEFELAEKDIVMAMSGATTGKAGRIDKRHIPCLLNQRVAKFVIKDASILPDYLFWILRSPFYQKAVWSFASGCAQPNISSSQLEAIQIPITDKDFQERINSLLSKAESALEKRRGTIRLCDEFLKSVFIEMFGDPVKNSKNLKVVSCGEIALHVSSGSTPLGGEKTYLKEGILFIRSQNVLMNRLDLSDVAYISNEVNNRMKRTWVKKDDVLLNITGASIGRISFYAREDDTANVNQHVCIIRPDNKKVLPEYLSFLISMPNYQKTILGKNAGATRQAFNFEQIKRFQIPLATLSEQQKFAEIVQKVERLKEKLKQSEFELQNLFNSLMQRAFKGELFKEKQGQR